MKKIKLYSLYDNYGSPDAWTKEESQVECYVDFFTQSVQNNDSKKFALLIEPRSLLRDTYKLIEERLYNNFEYVFTHDNELLKLPNAKPIVFGGVWDTNDIPKTKGISMISSNKNMCELHRIRTEIAKSLEGIVDTYGTYKGNGNFVSTYDAHAPYKFAIIIENQIDDYWFTEKICNCFSNKCVPIYYGAKRIDEFFNGNGIVHVENVYDIPNIVRNIDVDKLYNQMLPAIDDNFEIVRQYSNFDNWFFKTYHKELDKLFN